MVIQRGDVIQLGPHRLMCGDATVKSDVNKLMGTSSAYIVFSSPPYLAQRSYHSSFAHCRPWTSMMTACFMALPLMEKSQVFINLGIVHLKGEWSAYWNGFFENIRALSWRQFGWYVWDKMEGTPGCFGGRFAPSFEFIFHFNRTGQKPNKILPCRRAGEANDGASPLKSAKSQSNKYSHIGRPIQSHKISDSTVRIGPEKFNRTSHPAVFPVGLPSFFIQSFKTPDTTIYDPFCGSGSTLIAAEQNRCASFGMEISPKYCQIAVDRYWRYKEKQKA